MVLELDTSGQGYKTTFTLHSTNVWNKVWFHCKSWKCRGSSNECIMWAVNSADFWRGGWQLQASFSQSFLLQFWKFQCQSGSKYPEFLSYGRFSTKYHFFETLCMYHRKVHPSSRTKHLSHWTAVEYLPTCLSAYAAVAEQSRSTDYLITDYGIRIILAPMRLLERCTMGHRSTTRMAEDTLSCPDTGTAPGVLAGW